jgi:hypothetical protein
VNIGLVFSRILGCHELANENLFVPKVLPGPPGPPKGKTILLRTWYKHAAQRQLEEQMSPSERNAQQKLHIVFLEYGTVIHPTFRCCTVLSDHLIVQMSDFKLCGRLTGGLNSEHK